MIELTASQQQRLVEKLVAVLTRTDGVVPRHIETHISHVLIHDGHAYKIKKAIANAFLDQSTLARRRHACDEELRLNRRLAPDLYLEAVPITGSIEQPAIGGPGPQLDVAVKMRAFDDDGLWDQLASRGELTAADVDELAVVLARFHHQAAVAPAGGWLGTPAQVRQQLLDSLRDLQSPPLPWPEAADRRALAQLVAWEAQAFDRLQPLMARRLAAGRVRECHGDLHLGNVAREAGHCLVFDGVEFNDEFRWLDVISELAFMAMDLHAHGLHTLAHRFVNRYFEEGGDYEGLCLLDYLLVHRALVRAKVAQLRAAQEADAERAQALAAARRYLALGLGFVMPRPRALLITHGLSGSGKTTLTQSLLEALGAVRVRADVERKRLVGLQALQGSRSAVGTGLYAPAMSEATYARLFDAAAAVIEGGWPAILDATFLRRSARDAARRHAATLGVPLIILRFTAAPDVLRERLRRRSALGQDASEADEAVLDAQEQAIEPLQDDERAALHEVVADAREARVDWSPLVRRLGIAVADR